MLPSPASMILDQVGEYAVGHASSASHIEDGMDHRRGGERFQDPTEAHQYRYVLIRGPRCTDLWLGLAPSQTGQADTHGMYLLHRVVEGLRGIQSIFNKWLMAVDERWLICSKV